MRRPIAMLCVLALVFLLLGAAGAALAFAFLPNQGSTPAIYDDFQWSSIANGFWHVNAIGATAEMKNSSLTLRGNTVELDHRLQTDPYRTVVIARVRGHSFHKFSLGIGTYHAGTVGLEFDNDGVKCGRGSDYGWQIDVMKSWTVPPTNQWFYLMISVKNPYPNVADLRKAEKLANERNNPDLVKRVTLTCSMYDASGHLVTTDTPLAPPPNTHYVSIDETYIRTWDSGNNYQIDWLYAGPPSGNPARAFLKNRR